MLLPGPCPCEFAALGEVRYIPPPEPETQVMSFGAMFATIVFLVLPIGWGHRLTVGGALPGKAAWAVWTSLGVCLAIGLLRGRPWSRWVGAAAGLLLAALGARLVVDRGDILDHVVLFAALGASVLLVVPASGRIQGDATPSATGPPTSKGRALGWLSSALTVALAVLSVPALVGSAGGSRPARPAAVPPGTAGRAALRPPDQPSVPAPAPAPAVPVEWTSFGAGLERAKAEGKPLLVNFYATWCGQCRRLDRITLRDAQVTRRLGEVVTVRVDAEEEKPRDGFRGADLAARNDVRGYPTLILFDSGGREISRRAGFLEPRSFLAWIDGALAARPRGRAAAPLRAAAP